MADGDFDRIRQVLQKYVTDEAELDAVFRGEPFLTATSADSLTMVHIVTDLEVAFGVRFDLTTIEQVFETVHTLAAFLGGGQGESAG